MSHVLYYLCCYSTTTHFLSLIFMRLFCGSLTHILPVTPARLFTGWRRGCRRTQGPSAAGCWRKRHGQCARLYPSVSGVGRFTDADPGAGEFIPSLLDNCWLAIAATDNETVNQQVSDAAEARRIFCNVVDAPRQASFIMPSIIDRSPLMVAVSSGGTSPVLARLLREAGVNLTPASWSAGPLRRPSARSRQAAVCHRRRTPTVLGEAVR